jgi:hypothetical protein
LRLDRVFARTQKSFDSQVLFDPFEEQLDLPTVFVQSSDCQRWQVGVVGQKDHGFTRVWVFESNAAQVL